MAAIGGISDKYIEEYAVVKPIKNDQINMMFIRRRWIYELCGILTIIAIVIGIWLPSMNNDKKLPPFVLTAYAFDTNSSVIGQNLTGTIQIPVSHLEMADGTKGFLFSIDCETRSKPPALTIVTECTYEYGAGSLEEIAGVNLESGKQYFFFKGQDINDFKNVFFSYTDEETGGKFEICIRIAKQENGYYASLQELKSFPTKID